jgi:hypothetical protein
MIDFTGIPHGTVISCDVTDRGLARVGPTHRRIPKLCQTSSGIVPRMRIPRTRFCRAANLITICEAIPPPSISKVAQNSPNPNRLS